MTLFHEARDELNAIDARAEAESRELTIDQQLKVAEIKALLSIAQELSGIHHDGINPKYSAQ
jgi:hypothetical protein